MVIVAAALLLGAAAPPRPPSKTSAFAQEEAMSPAMRLARWKPLVTAAARRFAVPAPWIAAVMRMESGGRTMLGPTQPIVSDKGAMGLMQLLPQTYADMRAQYALGSDPFAPKDNILAGTAYLKWLRGKYGYPALFAAYNAGPGRVDDLLAGHKRLPDETVRYVGGIGDILDGRAGAISMRLVQLTQPDGIAVAIDPIAVRAIRAVDDGEYAPGVRAVIDMGAVKQGVIEDVDSATRAIRIRGGRI